MKGYYFAKLVTEQRCLGGTLWQFGDQGTGFCAFQHLDSEILAIKMAMFSWQSNESWGQ